MTTMVTIEDQVRLLAGVGWESGVEVEMSLRVESARSFGHLG